MKIYRTIFLFSLFLALTATESFAQCGADGTQPCPPKNSPKKSTVSKKQAADLAAKLRAERLAIQRETAERQRILREKLRRKQLAKKSNKPEMPEWMKNVSDYAKYWKNAKPFDLFPVEDITPGETGSKYLSLVGENCGITNTAGTLTGCYIYKGIYFYTDENNVSDSLYFSKLRLDGMPENWKTLGFNFDLSINQWKELFEQKGYKLTSLPNGAPKVVTESGKKFVRDELSTLVKLPKGSAVIRLNFVYAPGKTSFDDKGTLFSISVDNSN